MLLAKLTGIGIGSDYMEQLLSITDVLGIKLDIKNFLKASMQFEYLFFYNNYI